MSYVLPTADQFKASIPAEVGDFATPTHPTGVVLENLDVIWGMFADKAAVDIRLQYLYALRKAWDYIKGNTHAKVSRRIGGMSIDYTAQARAIEGYQALIDAEIIAFEQGSPLPAAAQIARQHPIEPSDTYTIPAFGNFTNDANDPAVQGNPYIGMWPWR